MIPSFMNVISKYIEAPKDVLLFHPFHKNYRAPVKFPLTSKGILN